MLILITITCKLYYAQLVILIHAHARTHARTHMRFTCFKMKTKSKKRKVRTIT
jgi:hypothetical protein